ncbi:hypothetical protein T06_12362 [Trichinella sp. T6]|nr:hypothetical protein T06_12362 [Trichinella sp. T6]
MGILSSTRENLRVSSESTFNTLSKFESIHYEGRDFGEQSRSLKGETSWDDRSTDALEVQLQLEKALTGEEHDQEATQWDTLTERIQMARREARARIRQMEDSLSDCSARSNDLNHRSNSKRKANGKLPELKMPAFLDKVLEFPTFWDRFQACVHRRTDLDDASKFAWRTAPMEAFSSEFQALSRLENSELSTHMKHQVILPGDHAYAGSSETAILGAVGTHPSEEGNLELFCLPACNGQTDPAENSGLAI